MRLTRRQGRKNRILQSRDVAITQRHRMAHPSTFANDQPLERVNSQAPSRPELFRLSARARLDGFGHAVDTIIERAFVGPTPL